MDRKTKEYIKSILGDLRCLTLFPKRYDPPQGMPASYWEDVSKRYYKTMSRICDGDWHIIEYKDGRKELAYLRLLKNGLFSGSSLALYRGRIIPHLIRRETFANIESIYLAF